MKSAYPNSRTGQVTETSGVIGKFTKNNAIRAELGALQSKRSINPGLMAGVKTIPDRLLSISGSVENRSCAVGEEPSTPNINDPMWRQKRAQVVDAIIKARRRRERYFNPNLFADPAWDIFLSLYHAELIQRRTCTSDLCMDANVPPTTALRWIKSLADAGILVRRVDPLDARRVFIELSSNTSESMSRFFADFPTDA